MPSRLIPCPICGTPITTRFPIHDCKPRCSHKVRKIIVKAKELIIKCEHCKQDVHSRRRVLSSSVYALGKIIKNSKKVIDLEVQHMGKGGGYGKTYVYFDVPAYHYEKALRAKSIGHYIAELIADGEFEYALVK